VASRLVDDLRSPDAIRERAESIFHAELSHFAVREDRLPAVVDRVLAVTREAYPDGNVPIHGRFRHFGERLAELEGLDPRAQIDLVVTSVLLDAGAGARWRYREAETGLELSRSEGLAVASLHMFMDGAFSHRNDPSVTAEGLAHIDAAALARGFQAGPHNPLVGLENRAKLLRDLGDALEAHPELFGDDPRPGHLLDHVPGDARAILAAVLTGLESIWPRRLELDGVNLGDVWRHPRAGGEGRSAGLVPFHKLSQWLTYSLVEPYERAGVPVSHVDALTGLAEYRNGGLFVDMGVLEPKHEAVTADAHPPESEIVVEWRALTIALLDRVAAAAELPLAKILEGGTWRAGREVARERRADGAPPIRVESDGTLF
jgi:hypothetical protein